jgi:hypothetical protein
LAEKVVGDPAVTVDAVYSGACVFALASAGPGNAAADAHAARAVELLRQALAKGWTDISHMLRDADLDPLRRRADYATLLWDLADMPAAAPK